MFSSSTLIRLDKDAFEGHLCQTVNNFVKQNKSSLLSPLRKRRPPQHIKHMRKRRPPQHIKHIRDTLVFLICLMCWGGRLFLKGDKRLDLFCLTKLLTVNFFSLRVINAWNKLPCHVVSANSTNQFKSQLDHYWIENGYGFLQTYCLLYTHKPLSVSGPRINH